MKLPVVLKLKEGLEWTGSLKVLQKQGGMYAVAFDAYAPASSQHIYDRYAMTSEIIEGWTGVNVDN
jgi:hypothetical protein